MPHPEGSKPGASNSGQDRDPRRWRMLALLSLAMLLSLTAWMTATAVGPEFQTRWALTDGDRRPAQSRGHRAGSRALRCVRCTCGGRERDASDRSGLRERGGGSLPDRRLPGRRLSARHEDDLDLVPFRSRYGHRHCGRRPDRREGDTLPAEGDRRGGPRSGRRRGFRSRVDRCRPYRDRLSRWPVLIPESSLRVVVTRTDTPPPRDHARDGRLSRPSSCSRPPAGCRL